MLKKYEKINNFLLAGDKFMPTMHVRQPEFSYSTCGSFIKNKERLIEIHENMRFKIYASKWTR